MLGLVAPAAPLAAQDFTVGATEVHTSTVHEVLSNCRSDGVTLCKDELDQIHTDGHQNRPDSFTEEESTDEDGERINHRHLLNSNDADFLGTTDPLVVQEADDD